MASRENHTLQIALIIFALLTVTLGITTYVFFDKYELESTKALAAQQKEQQATKERDAAVADFGTLKTEIVGAAPTDDLEAINKKLEQLRNKVYPTKKSATRPTLIAMNIYSHQSAFAANKTMLKVQAQNVELQNQIERLQAIEAKKREVAEKGTQVHLARAAETEATYISETAKRNAAALKHSVLQNRNNETFANREIQSEAAIDKLRKDIQSKKEHIEDLEEIIVRLRERKGDPKKPDGLITSVSQNLKFVFINLGSEDGVTQGLPFEVHAGKGPLADEAKPKARIEVTRITGVHQAEARIIKRQTDDPILTSDRIYNKHWKPGQHNGYALARWMDIDGDGRSDRDKVKSLIRKNGGVIDAEVDDDGNVIGKISTKTDFLILGEEPKLNREAIQKGSNRFQAEANKLRIPVIRLDKLLDNLDYKGRRKPPRKELTFRKGT